MFIKSDFLYGYTCLVPEEIHHYVDQHPVCSDIAMNMLVSGQTGIAPVLVNPQKAYKFENKHPKTIQERSACIDGLSALFNGKNPLVYNNDIVSKVSSSKKQYQPIKPLSWSKWSESFDNMNI